MKIFKTFIVLLLLLSVSTLVYAFNIVELKKLIKITKLINTTECQIVYGSRTYDHQFVYRFAIGFLATRYHDESARSWIYNWCSTTKSGKLIWIKYPDNSYRLAREVLIEALNTI